VRDPPDTSTHTLNQTMHSRTHTKQGCTRVHTHTWETETHTHTPESHKHIHTHTHTHTHTHMYTRTHTLCPMERASWNEAYILLCISERVHTYIHTYVYIYVYKYMYVYIYTYTYMHIWTLSDESRALFCSTKGYFAHLNSPNKHFHLSECFG